MKTNSENRQTNTDKPQTESAQRLVRDAALGGISRREFLARAAAMGIAAPTAMAFLSGDAVSATPKKGGHLIVGVNGGSTGETLDPALCTNNTCTIVGFQWGSPLTRFSPDGQVLPFLAKSFEPADGGKRWIFNLRRGITFHNGKEMDSADVVDTLRRHSDENSKSGALGIMQSIMDIQADGKYAVALTLDGPNADLPFLMADYHLLIQPAGSAGDEGIGTGPYILEEVDHGVRYVSRRNPNYFDPTEGHVESIETLVINDGTARVSALQTGKAHMICRVDPKITGLLAKSPGVKIENVSGRAHYVFLMHANTAPFDNNDLRLALKYAVDRELLVKQILQGYGSVGNDFPINAAYPLFSDDIPQRPYDPDKAKFHFKKSGHSGPVVIRTSDAAFPGAVDAALLFSESAKKAGIDLEVKREPEDGYWSDVWNKQPFCVSYWSGRPVQDQMYSTAYKSDAEWNDTRFLRPDFDKLLLQARAELDNTKRKAIYREMALLVRDEGGLILPMFNDFIDAIRTEVKGYIPHPNAKLGNDFAPIQVWLES